MRNECCKWNCHVPHVWDCKLSVIVSLSQLTVSLLMFSSVRKVLAALNKIAVSPDVEFSDIPELSNRASARLPPYRNDTLCVSSTYTPLEERTTASSMIFLQSLSQWSAMQYNNVLLHYSDQWCILQLTLYILHCLGNHMHFAIWYNCSIYEAC